MRSWGTLLAVTAAAIVAGGAARAATLDDVKSRGVLRCGVGVSVPGFTYPDNQGVYRGFDIDFCHAIAAAVLGGCSLRGGEGSIIGIIIGTTLLLVLQNLVNLLGIPSSLNFAVMGAVVLIGVLADQILQRRTK